MQYTFFVFFLFQTIIMMLSRWKKKKKNIFAIVLITDNNIKCDAISGLMAKRKS